MVALKFAEEYREPILAGEKRATIRVGFEDSLRIGEWFDLHDSRGRKFAAAPATGRWRTIVSLAADMDIEGHTSYNSVDALIVDLDRHYPDHEITDTTTVDVIEWSYRELYEHPEGGEPSEMFKP